MFILRRLEHRTNQPIGSFVGQHGASRHRAPEIDRSTSGAAQMRSADALPPA
jgi:hypothetical protein